MYPVVFWAPYVVLFLEYVVGGGVLRPKKGIVLQILDIQVATRTTRKIRSLLRQIHVYAKFVPNFLNIVARLSVLMSKHIPGMCHLVIYRRQDT